MTRASLVGLGAALSLLGAQTSAFAYCRTTTCNFSKEDCEVVDGCARKGFPLYWSSKCTSFSVQKDASPLRGITYDAAQNVISQGFLTWRDADCGNGTHPSIDIATTPPVNCGKQEYNKSEGNANIWIFRDKSWPYEGSPNTLALTTLTFNLETGEIVDADVEINSFDKELTIGDANVRADLQSIVTHEAGHFLGLAHSPISSATMFASYNPGETKLRSLSVDDIAGICDIYPPGRVLTGDCEPRHGFSPNCYVPKDTSGCSAAPLGHTARTGILAAVLGFVGAGLVLRRRSRERPPGSG